MTRPNLKPWRLFNRVVVSYRGSYRGSYRSRREFDRQDCQTQTAGKAPKSHSDGLVTARPLAMIFSGFLNGAVRSSVHVLLMSLTHTSPNCQRGHHLRHINAVVSQNQHELSPCYAIASHFLRTAIRSCSRGCGSRQCSLKRRGQSIFVFLSRSQSSNHTTNTEGDI